MFPQSIGNFPICPEGRLGKLYMSNWTYIDNIQYLVYSNISKGGPMETAFLILLFSMEVGGVIMISRWLNYKCRHCRSRSTSSGTIYRGMDREGRWAILVHCQKCESSFQATPWKRFWFPRRMIRWAGQCLIPGFYQTNRRPAWSPF